MNKYTCNKMGIYKVKSAGMDILKKGNHDHQSSKIRTEEAWERQDSVIN